MSPNPSAFLTMLSASEGTDRAPDPYRVCEGYQHTIVDLSDHPTSTGEWMGNLITVGVYAGEHTTAAGRYQITHPTWVRLKAKLNLESFVNSCQDDAGIDLIKEAGALELVNAGDLEHAIWLCSNVWASLPGSRAGQQIRPMQMLIDAYQGAGGALA